MNDGRLSLTEPNEAPKKQSFVLSLLINIALIVILAGPWIWASLSSTHVDNPLRYIQETFRSVYSREKASWNEFKNDDLVSAHRSEALKSAP